MTAQYRRGKPPGNRRGDESGTTLIIALFFATIFSLVVVSVVTFTDAGLRASGAYVAQGKAAYSAAGATDTAIKRFSTGNPCGDYTSPPINGQQMIVHCDDLKAPGAALQNQPSDALLSLGTGAEGIQATTNLNVQGSVFSNSTINGASGGSMVVSGDISAIGDCNRATHPPLAPSQSPFATDCAHVNGVVGTPADPVAGALPDYTAPTTVIPARQTVPACPEPAAWLVTLTPGYYDDPGPLNLLTNGACQNAVVWLQPGTYYFDFTFRFPTGSGLWTINDKTVNVIGGNPPANGWNTTASPTMRPAIPDPNGCDQAQLAGPSGVQIMMGGGSRLLVSSGKIELCAPANATSQQVAVYGNPTPEAVHILKPTIATGVTGFSDPDHAFTIDEKGMLPGCSGIVTATTNCTADAAVGSSTPASIGVSGFVPNVPAGSVIQSATLRVRHEDLGDVALPGSLTVTALFNGNNCGTDGAHQNGIHNLAQSLAGQTEDTISLAPCGLTDPALLTDFTVTFSASLDSGGTSATEHLDGIWLDVGYRTPTTFKPTSVVAANSFPNPVPNPALEIGEQPIPLTDDATVSATGPATAMITLAGYGEPPIPTGSSIVSAVLRVAHAETGPAGASCTSGSCPTASISAGTCNNSLLPPQANGLGDFRLDLKHLCGVTTNSQLAGLTATFRASVTGGATGTASLDGMWLELVYDPPALTRLPIPPAVSPNFTNPENALIIGEAPTPLTADATLRSTGTTDATIALSGYDHPTMPTGSAIDSAVLRIAHQDDTTAGAAPTPKVTVTAPGLSNPCSKTFAPHPGTIATDTFDLRLAPCNITDPSQLAGVTISYSAALGSGSTDGSDKLDGIALDLTFRPPAVRQPSTATSTASATTAAFANPDNAKAIGGPTSSATLDGTTTPATSAASIHLANFGAVSMPAGSVIDKVILRVAHQDDDTTPTPSPLPVPPPPTPQPPVATLAWTFTTNTCTSARTLTSHVGSIGEEFPIDLKTCGLTDPETQLASLAVTYTASLGANSTNAVDQLDGVELDIVYRVPTIEPTAGCLTLAPYPSTTNSCALIKTVPNGQGAADETRFVIQGTVYAPAAPLDLSMSQVSSQVVSRGLIARTMKVGLSAATNYTRSVIGVPPEPVLFTTYPAVMRAPQAVPTSTGFTNPDNALQIGEPPTPLTADADIAPSSSASISLAGYDPTSPLLTGPLDHAVLRVVHQDDGAMDSVNVTVNFPGSTCDGTSGHPALELPLHPGSAMAVTPVEDQVDLTPMSACSLTDASAIRSLTVTVTATAGSTASATEHFDGTQIDVLSVPLLRAAVAFQPGKATIKEWSVQR